MSRLPRLVLLILAGAITTAALMVAAPRKIVEFNTLGESAINTAPAIRINLASERLPEPEAVPEPAPAANAKPEPEPEPEPYTVAKTPMPEPTPSQTEPSQPETQAEMATSQPAKSMTTKTAAQVTVPLQNAGERSEVDSYVSRLSRHLARFYEYPHRARRLGQEGTPVIVFEFRRDGTLVAQSLKTGSGHELLDQAALAMLVQAAPLPDVPGEMAGQRFRYVLPVRFRLR